MLVADTRPSLSEPARRSMSSQYGAIFCRLMWCVEIGLSNPSSVDGAYRHDEAHASADKLKGAKTPPLSCFELTKNVKLKV